MDRRHNRSARRNRRDRKERRKLRLSERFENQFRPLLDNRKLWLGVSFILGLFMLADAILWRPSTCPNVSETLKIEGKVYHQLFRRNPSRGVGRILRYVFQVENQLLNFSIYPEKLIEEHIKNRKLNHVNLLVLREEYETKISNLRKQLSENNVNTSERYWEVSVLALEDDGKTVFGLTETCEWVGFKDNMWLFVTSASLAIGLVIVILSRISNRK